MIEIFAQNVKNKKINNIFFSKCVFKPIESYNLCIKLGAKISCRDLLDEVAAHHEAK